ncbi:MAG TPA: regulatory iron-sulfur-containing complex subunit RicT [Flavobacteriales bacterium]|nr:regulatory iron-sulfur-containing complex subunit RicT [Flavobacteriales bacterium]
MGCEGCAKGAQGKTGGCGGACGGDKRQVRDWLAGVPLPGGVPGFDAVEVRFKNTRRDFFRNANSLPLAVGDAVTVEASSGYDVGVVCLAGELVRAQMKRKGAGTDTYELRKVVRRSTQADLDRWHAARKHEDEVKAEAHRLCREAKLDIKVSDTEFQGDGTRATVYYTAEERVDFRNVVRGLSDRFHVRIDMKQLGARQEAARLGGLGPSGRELCSSTWLTDLRSVSTSAARYQQLALNPQKLTGLCGKLKCCLNFELDMYVEAIKSYPSPNAKLKTKQGTGTHMKTDIFKEYMWYLFKKPGEPTAMAALTVDTVRDILARNKQGIEPEVDLNIAEIQAAERSEEEAGANDYGNVIDGGDDLSRFDKKIKDGKRRNRDKKKKKMAGGPPHNKPQADGPGKRPHAEAGHKDAGAKKHSGGHQRNRDGRGRRRKGPAPGTPPPANGKKPDNP